MYYDCYLESIAEEMEELKKYPYPDPEEIAQIEKEMAFNKTFTNTKK